MDCVGEGLAGRGKDASDVGNDLTWPGWPGGRGFPRALTPFKVAPRVIDVEARAFEAHRKGSGSSSENGAR
jgi:hypothetical protein